MCPLLRSNSIVKMCVHQSFFFFTDLEQLSKLLYNSISGSQATNKKLLVSLCTFTFGLYLSSIDKVQCAP